MIRILKYNLTGQTLSLLFNNYEFESLSEPLETYVIINFKTYKIN
jgi:hypothetical protein